RELLRAHETSGLARLDAFTHVDAGRYLPLSDQALRVAAELWAQVRRQGQPCSSPPDIDIDVIVAAQALTAGPGAELLVITTNPRHLRWFVDARLWSDVTP